MESIIEVKNLSVHYGQTEALKDVSFAIEKGDFIGLAGPNGGGKTTLIKAILGLIPISNGKIKILGITTEKFGDWGKIGYLPQKSSTINALFPATVNEIITLGLLSQKKIPKRIIKNDKIKVNQILEELGISDLQNKMISELSGGQQQKVLLARALVSNPEILIFDEPSTALDPNARESFFNLVQKLNKENGIAIILITHDTGYIGSYANKLLYLDHELKYFGNIEGYCEVGEENHSFERSGGHIIWHQHN
jgi:zinc transport system ATP-binding protein